MWTEYIFLGSVAYCLKVYYLKSYYFQRFLKKTGIVVLA